MTAAFYFDEYVVVITSRQEQKKSFFIEEHFSASEFLILTKTFFAIGSANSGISKMFSLFKQNQTHNKRDNYFEDFQIGLYKIPIIYKDEGKDSSLFLNLINITIKQHNKICKICEESLSIFADKELFDAYFVAIREIEIKFEKILYISSEREN